MIMEIDEALTARERYLLIPDSRSSGETTLVISSEKDGDLKLYDHRFEEPPIRCRKIAIDKLLKL